MTHDPELSITRWFSCLRDGDHEAEALLYEHYFPQLVQLARRRFDADRDPVLGADATAQSVFQLIAQGARRGRFDAVTGRDDFWRILVCATRRKVIDQTRRQQSLRRGGGFNPQPLSAVVVENAVTPEAIVSMQEQMEFLLAELRDDTLRQIALDRLSGYTNEEIAERQQVSVRTIERKLKLIREDWKKTLETR